MPLRGLERDNLAQEIPPTLDSDRDHHYASFEFYPFHEGMSFAVYKGLLSSQARRAKTFCVVKALLDHGPEGSLLTAAVSKAREAQRLATKFNSVVGYEAVTFQQPLLARVQSVSDFVGFFKCVVPHEKRLKKHELVIMEDFVEGEFVIFNTSNGAVPNNGGSSQQSSQKKATKSKGKIKLETRGTTHKGNNSCGGSNNLAQAFSHFTWHETNKLIVCDLKGVYGDNCYSFSNPTIHSVDSAFGPSDRGSAGIAEVFSSHRCTNVCRDWNQFISPGSNSKNQINFCDQESGRLLLMESSKSSKNICTKENKLSV